MARLADIIPTVQPMLPDSRNMRNLKDGRIEGLDALRFLAVFLIHWSHLHPEWITGQMPFLRLPIVILTRWSWLGVDLFFVLSGYLIGNLIFMEISRTNKFDWSRFLIRRAFKIYPLLWCLLLLAIASTYVTSKTFLGWKIVLGEVFFLQNYIGKCRPQTWSLAIEEHFYLAFALLAVIMVRTPTLRRRWPWFVFIASACILTLRCANVISTPGESFCWPSYSGTPFRIDSLMIGTALAFFRINDSSTFLAWMDHKRWILGLAALFPFVLATVQLMWISRWVIGPGFTAVAIGFAGLIVLTESIWPVIPSIARPLLNCASKIGRHSYPIYLFHVDSLQWVELACKSLNLPLLYVPWLGIPLSFGVGIAIGWILEKPMLMLRDRMYPRT